MHRPNDVDDISRSIGETSAPPADAVPVETMAVWEHEDDDEPEDIHTPIPYSVHPRALT
jgi:hypothetical protein